MAIKRDGEGRRVGIGGGDDGGGGRKRPPLTEKSTNVSMNEERRLGIWSQNVFEFCFSISIFTGISSNQTRFLKIKS